MTSEIKLGMTIEVKLGMTIEVELGMTIEIKLGKKSIFRSTSPRKVLASSFR